MSTPFFSIVTPVYNRADTVLDCIRSVLSQSFTDYEMILVNDGSSDQTAERIRSLERMHPDKLMLIDYQPNKGVNYARNRGIEKAKGQYLLFLDSDDHLTGPDSLLEVADQIQQHPGYAHYLFRVSDRESDPLLPHQPFEFLYKDWITGRATGDYVHVIKHGCFEGMPFLEEFRIYEALNWLRVLRNNQQQFYIPLTITTRDRDRGDSVTLETRLLSDTARQNKFSFLERHLQWYGADFKAFGMTEKFKDDVWNAVLLGISLGERERTANIIRSYVPSGTRKWSLNVLNSGLFDKALSEAIRMKSNYNQRKKVS